MEALVAAPGVGLSQHDGRWKEARVKGERLCPLPCCEGSAPVPR